MSGARRPPKKCNCKKSRCLKLYCDCFAAGQYCKHSCSCQSCMNTADNRCSYQSHSKELSMLITRCMRRLSTCRDLVVNMREQVRQRNPQVNGTHISAVCPTTYFAEGLSSLVAFFPSMRMTMLPVSSSKCYVGFPAENRKAGPGPGSSHRGFAQARMPLQEESLQEKVLRMLSGMLSDLQTMASPQ